MTLDRASAKRLGLVGASVGIARGSVQSTRGRPAKLVLKLPRVAKRKLTNAKSLKLTVRITARSGGDTATDTRRITLKR